MNKVVYFWLIFLSVSLVIISGCGTTNYYYATGRKAELMTKVYVYKLSDMLDKKQAKADKQTKEIFSKLQREINPEGLPSENTLKAKDEGVAYQFQKGESQLSILSKLSEPHKREMVMNKKGYDEIWKYEFCIMYFKNKKLKDLSFTKRPSEGVFMYKTKGIF